jgi:hypothetical protein
MINPDHKAPHKATFFPSVQSGRGMPSCLPHGSPYLHVTFFADL